MSKEVKLLKEGGRSAVNFIPSSGRFLVDVRRENKAGVELLDGTFDANAPAIIVGHGPNSPYEVGDLVMIDTSVGHTQTITIKVEGKDKKFELMFPNQIVGLWMEDPEV